MAHARRVLARLHEVQLDRDLVERAATVAPGVVLRSLDALHLAAAELLGADLRAVVTYDHRMQDGATALGFAVAAPG